MTVIIDEIEDKIMTIVNEKRELVSELQQCRKWLKDEEFKHMKAEEYIMEMQMWDKYIEWLRKEYKEHPEEWNIDSEESSSISIDELSSNL